MSFEWKYFLSLERLTSISKYQVLEFTRGHNQANI